MRVAQYLARNGYEPINVTGGMLAWAERAVPSLPTTAARALSEQPSLGWSDDPGVFPVRHAVERAGPAARLVPRCNGTLLAPSATGRRAHRRNGVPPAPPRLARAVGPAERPPRLPAGYRWIAVRPGAAPPPRRRPRLFGPDPALCGDPPLGSRRSLRRRVRRADGRSRAAVPRSARCVQPWSRLSPCSALPRVVHIIRYALLMINRDHVLQPWSPGWRLGSASRAASPRCSRSFLTLVFLTNWLIARRVSSNWRNADMTDPRPAWEMRVGCLVPLVNLFLGAGVRHRAGGRRGSSHRLRPTIVTWWLRVDSLSTLLSVFSIATSFTTDPQAIADSTP